MLHGRSSFLDESRRFTRFLFWFVEPFPCPNDFATRASVGSSNIARKLEGHSFWTKQHLGVDAPQYCPQIVEELKEAFNSFLNPQDCSLWNSSNFRKARVQEAIVSSLWKVLNEADFNDSEFIEMCRSF